MVAFSLFVNPITDHMFMISAISSLYIVKQNILTNFFGSDKVPDELKEGGAGPVGEEL